MDEIRSFTGAAVRERRTPGLALVVRQADEILMAEGFGELRLFMGAMHWYGVRSKWARCALVDLPIDERVWGRRSRIAAC